MSSAPDDMKVTVEFTPAEWYAMMHVITGITRQDATVFCKEAIMARVQKVVRGIVSGERKQHFDPIGWWVKHTAVGLKRQQLKELEAGHSQYD